MQPALAVGIELVAMLFQIGDQVGTMAGAFIRLAEGIDFQLDAGQAEVVPQASAHEDLLRVNIRSGIAERLHAHLVELAVAAFLRPLVAEHRPHVPELARAVIKQIVLEHGTHAGCRALRAQRQLLAVQAVLEGVHLLLDDVGDCADGARKQWRRLDQRHAHRPVAVAAQPITHQFLELFPQFGFVGQDVVHPADRLQCLGHFLASRRIGARHVVLDDLFEFGGDALAA